jgi:hypothetical protein
MWLLLRKGDIERTYEHHGPAFARILFFGPSVFGD